MSYNLNVLTEKEGYFSSSDCKIVFANSYAAATDLKASFLSQNPGYISEINENFVPYRKVGPFQIKNKKKILDLLYSTKEVQDTLSAIGNTKTASYVREEMEKMGIEHYADLPLKSLNPLQLLRASYLYEIFEEKDEFLLCDNRSEKIGDRQKRIESKRTYSTIVEYMSNCEKCIYGSYNIIWITDLTADEMLELLGNNVGEDDYFFSFYALDGQNIIKLDKTKLLSDFAKTSAAAKIAYENACKYDRFFTTALPQYSGQDDLKKAFDLHKTAAEMGHPGAQFSLGELYAYGCDACVQDLEKALYWYIMAEYGKNHIEGISEDIIKEVHYLAPIKIKAWVLDVPSGKTMLRKYAGDKAEALIKEAESEAVVQKLVDDMSDLLDQDELNREMGEALNNLLNRKY